MTRANVERWRDLVREELRLQGSPLPEGFVLAIIDAESQGVPTAYRNEPKIADGSHGLMQILYKTAKGEGYAGQPSGLFDPATNIRYGVKFASGLWRRLGNAADVASAYNGGVRPAQGFGGVYYGEPFDSVLARDPKTGAPITTRRVNSGEYANQPYVDKILRLTPEYGNAQQLPPVVIDGGGVSGAVVLLGVGLVAWGVAKAAKLV